MPYILKKDREKFSPYLDQIAENIKSPGELNYVITMLIKKAYGENLNYKLHNEIIGVLECCKLEYYRRRIEIYENLKAGLNGDVWDS